MDLRTTYLHLGNRRLSDIEVMLGLVSLVLASVVQTSVAQIVRLPNVW